jgi:hypothetical protein
MCAPPCGSASPVALSGYRSFWHRLFSGRGFVPAAPLLAVVLWSRRPGKGKLAKILEESSVGGSVNRAQALVDEIAQFERE